MSEAITILCDMRETKSGIIEQLRQLGAAVQVGELSVGDFVASADVVIERKTAIDFVSSMIDGRLHNQAGKLRLQYSRPILLVTGDIYSTRSAINKDALDGALSYLAAVLGISVLYVRHEAAAAGLIYRIAKQCQEGVGDVALRRGKIEPGQDHALFVLEGLPGIGRSLCIRLLDHFRSVRAVMCASEEALREVPGLGPKKAAMVYQSINWTLPQGERVVPGKALISDPL